MKCPYCGKLFLDKKEACPNCGAPNIPSLKITCKNCGHEIEDPSLSFCPNCSVPLTIDSPIIKSKQKEKAAKKNYKVCVDKIQKRGKIIHILGYLFLIVVILFAGFVGFRACVTKNDGQGSNTEGNDTLIHRKAQTDDIEIDFTYDLPKSVKFTIVANVDIDNLAVTFTFTDSNKDVLSTKTKQIGNVKGGVPYYGSFNTVDLDLGILLKINSTAYHVADGIASIIT